MIRWAPSSSGCSGSVGGRRARRSTPRPAGLKIRSTRSRSRRPRACAAQLHQLEPQPGAHAREAVDDRARLGGREVHRGPGVEQQPVPVQALARRAAGLERAHRLERLADHALELGQRGDAPVLVAHRREVADLGERDEALVARVLARGRGTGRCRRPRGGARARTRPAARGPSARPASGACRGTRCAPRRRREKVRTSISRREHEHHPIHDRRQVRGGHARGEVLRAGAQRGRGRRAAARPRGSAPAWAASARSAASKSSGSPSVAATW